MNNRGGAYVLVLGCATMLAVVGLGAIAVSRTQIRSTTLSRDWARCEVLAQSAAETALARINTDAAWRSSIGTDEQIVQQDARTYAGFMLEDPVDGELSKGDRDPVLVRTVGRAGEATRMFSFECVYRPPPTLDVLKYGLYAAGSVSAATCAVSGGPLGTPSLSVTGTLVSNVRVGSLSNSGTIVGEVRTGEVSLAALSDGSIAGLDSRAVAIGYASLSGGQLRRCVLSATSNPYGAVSTAGLYVIRVPTLQTLTIREARISGTLIVELALHSQLDIRGPLLWDSGSGEYPALVIKAIATANVAIGGTPNVLSESSLGVNFNPASTPYNGESDSDTADSYPSEIRGVIHTVGLLPSVTIGSSANIVGTVVCEGAVTIGGGARITHDPQLLITPPAAYRTGPSGMSPVAGSWRSEVDD